MRREALCTALLLAAGALAPSASAAAEPTVRVAVATDRFAFADTTLRGTYTCAAPCPRPRGSADVDAQRHEVRRPRLGFAASRSSTAVGAPQADGSTVQEESVTVRVTEPGDLDVALTGTKNTSVDATTIPGTASPRGTEGVRFVRWHVANAARGDHTFRARFVVAGRPVFAGTYVTKATVERTARTTTLLAYAWGGQPAGRTVRRVSALTFAERIAPATGTPHPQAHPWYAVPDTAGLADTFEGSVSMDAYGAYAATAAGVAGGTSTLDLERVARGLSHYPLAGGIGWSWMSGAGEEKLTPNAGFVFNEAGSLSDITLALCAERAGYGDGDTGATLYDRDAGTVSAVADVFVVQTKRQGVPRGNAGRLRPDWSGRLVSGWASVSSRSALDTLLGPPLSERWFTHGASIGWVVAGGDLDNRNGSHDVRGTSAVVRVPKGEEIRSAFASTLILPHTEFDIDIAGTTRTALMIHPTVRPGGYWLRSTRRGYDRDWTTHTEVQIETGVAGSGGGVPALTSVRLVPPGTQAVVRYVVPGSPTRTVRLQPGAWMLTGIGNDLSVARLSPNDPRGCNSPL